MGKPLGKVLTTTLNPSFDLGQGSIPLVIEPDPNLYADLDVHLLLFPPVGANIVADVGYARLAGSKPLTVPGGVVTFSGGDTASMPKPVVGGTSPVFKVLFAFSAETGGVISPTITYDPDNYVLRASVACFAAVSYTKYDSLARIIIYSPEVTPLGSGGNATTFGVIAAFYPPRSMTTYQVPPFNVDDGNIEIELYRIVSDAVTNTEGEFEVPTNYPSSGAYTNPAASLVIDTTTSLKTQRVHEIGYMDLRGRAWVKTFFVPTLEPFVGDLNYVPNKRFVEGTIPEKTPLGDDIPKTVKEKALNFIKSKGYAKVA